MGNQPIQIAAVRGGRCHKGQHRQSYIWPPDVNHIVVPDPEFTLPHGYGFKGIAKAIRQPVQQEMQRRKTIRPYQHTLALQPIRRQTPQNGKQRGGYVLCAGQSAVRCINQVTPKGQEFLTFLQNRGPLRVVGRSPDIRELAKRRRHLFSLAGIQPDGMVQKIGRVVLRVLGHISL